MQKELKRVRAQIMKNQMILMKRDKELEEQKWKKREAEMQSKVSKANSKIASKVASKVASKIASKASPSKVRFED